MTKQVLEILINSNNFVSGNYISKVLKVSRTAVWKIINKLKEKGFIIDCINNKGYRIVKVPYDYIIPELIYIYCDNKIDFEIIYKESVDSTNKLAKELILKNKNSNIKNFVVIADEQYAGKGRMDRKWISEKGKDITMSIGLNLNLPITEYYKFTIICSVCIYNILEKYLGKDEINIFIKWPNDLYIENKKICGILSEMISEGNIIKYLIIGIGININSANLIDNAISFYKVKNHEFDRNKIIADFLIEFKKYLDIYKLGKSNEILNLWKSRIGFIGKIIKINNGFKEIEGKLVDVNFDGSVILETNNGKEQIYSGDLLL